MNQLMRAAMNILIGMAFTAAVGVSLLSFVSCVGGCNLGERGVGLHGAGDESHDESKRDAGIKGDGNNVEQNNNDVNIYYALIGLLAIDALGVLYAKVESAKARKHAYTEGRARRLVGADLRQGT